MAFEKYEPKNIALYTQQNNYDVPLRTKLSLQTKELKPKLKI